MPEEAIEVRGARVNNLKNISFSIPINQMTVVTGVSGSGKSSLAFDTIYAEGQRRYVESLSAYARQFLERMDKPDVDEVHGIAPAIAIRQKNSTRNPRSTVGTQTEIYDYLRLLLCASRTSRSAASAGDRSHATRRNRSPMKCWHASGRNALLRSLPCRRQDCDQTARHKQNGAARQTKRDQGATSAAQSRIDRRT